MTTCGNCGAHVSPDFARVFGDNTDSLEGCLDCMSARELHDGKALPGSSDGRPRGAATGRAGN